MMPDLVQFFKDHEDCGEAHPQQAHHYADKAQCHKAPATARALDAKDCAHPRAAAEASAPIAEEVGHRGVADAVADLLGAEESSDKESSDTHVSIG